MGVHETDAYPQIKELLGIPDDEPIFVIRAQDQTSTNALIDYMAQAKKAGCSDEFVADLADVSMAFASWRVRNPHKVKIPD